MNTRAELRKLWEEFPASHVAFQNMVAAMADAAEASGKRTIFGREKFPPAFEKFTASFKSAIWASLKDELISKGNAADDIVVEFLALLGDFAEAYPNWQDAYRFAASFFDKSNSSIILTLVNEILEYQRHLDRPRITYGSALEKPPTDKWWETDQRIKKDP